MYKGLFQLNLGGYIKNYCGGKIVENKYLRNLDHFIADESFKENLGTLIEKFRGNKQFSEITDLLHEIEVACLFHPRAIFRKEPGADLDDEGTLVEVKCLNEGRENGLNGSG